MPTASGARRPAIASVGRPAGRDSAETRQQLLVAARTAFARQGYAATSLREVATAAGVTLPTVYHHFGSKAGLFAAAYQDADGVLLAALEAAVAAHATFQGRLVAMVDAAAGVHRRDPSIGGVLSVGQLETARHPELADARGVGGAAVPTLLRRVADEAADQGELPAEADVDGVVALLSAMTLGVALTAAVLEPASADALFGEWGRLVAGDLLRSSS